MLLSIFKSTKQRTSPLPVFSEKRSSEICSKFTAEYPRQSVISIKLQGSFVEITLRHESSPVNLLHIFRTPFYENTYGGLLLKADSKTILEDSSAR